VNERLTTGERVLVVAWIVAVVVLPFTGIALVATGSSAAGTVVLVLALVAFLTPVKSILRRRIERRQD
jgi:uncharacterized membrane protein YhaH (DUF805 family)